MHYSGGDDRGAAGVPMPSRYGDRRRAPAARDIISKLESHSGEARGGPSALRSGIVLVLAFDTATAAVTVALSEWAPGGSPRLRAESKIVDRRRHAEVLAPAITTVLGEAQRRAGRSCPRSPSASAPGRTPACGSAWSPRARSAPCCRSRCTASARSTSLAWESRRTEPFVVATDARRKEVYWARYDSAAVRVDGPSVGKPADAAVPGLPVLGEGATLYPEVLERRGARSCPPRRAMAELVVTRLSGGAGPELLPPEPLYLRKPDAREPGPRKRVTPR